MTGRLRQLFGLALLTLIWLVVAIYFDLPDGKFHLWLLNVGQGDAVLIQEENGRQILVDGGPGDQIIPALSAHMPFWDRTIERVILSHPHSDHLDGLIEVAKRYRIGEVWLSGADEKTPDYVAWKQLLIDRHIPVRNVGAGDIVQRDKLRFEFLQPLQPVAGLVPVSQHDGTVVTRLVLPEGAILLTGDIDEGHEQELINAWCPTEQQLPCPALQSDILKVPHHGSRSGLSPEFLAAVAPKYGLISVGENNAYGHPNSLIIDRLKLSGATVYRTDQAGTIEVQVFDRELVAEPD